MTAQTLLGNGGWLGFGPREVAAISAPITFTFDALNDAFAIKFSAPKAGFVDRIEFRIDTSTLVGTLTYGFMGFDASGNPDGTFVESATVVNPVAGWQTTTTMASAGNRRNVTAGEQLVFVVKATAWTSGACTLGLIDNAGTASSNRESAWPFCMTSNAGAAWANAFDVPFAAMFYASAANGGTVETDATPVADGILPVSAVSTVSVSTGDPTLAGLYFSLSVPVTIDGLWFMVDLDNNITLRLYAGSVNADLLGATFLANKSTVTTEGGAEFRFAPVALTANTVYRAVLEGTAVGTTALRTLTVPTNGHADAMPGGKNFYLTQNNDAHPPVMGNFTETTTSIPMMGIRAVKLDDGAGGGGGLRLAGHGGLAG